MAALGLNYMGTKKALAPDIADVIAAAKSGPVLDSFSGMCAVGQAVGTKRQVWTNDVQIFAATVARSLFLRPDHPPRCGVIPDFLFQEFRDNSEHLERKLGKLLEEESSALAKKSVSGLKRVTGKSRSLVERRSFRAELPGLRRDPRAFPYRLFSYYYAGTYLGLRQCVEVDSLAFAIARAVQSRTLTAGQADWLRIALGMAMQKVATTTGHFAQYLELKEDASNRYFRQRARSVWQEFLDAIPTESPIGDWDWRARNRVFRSDTLSLLGLLQKAKARPAVVYADPPYTEDHYSRYYHLLETLVKYDYPEIDAKGRYRKRRFYTPFSIKSKAIAAFDRLASRTASLGAELVVSYPTQGLLSDLQTTPFRIIKPYFRKVEVCRRIGHSHSTHGASKGPASKAVTEIIYWARP